MQNKELAPLTSHHMQKISKVIIELNVEARTIKNLVAYEKNLPDLRLGKDFLDMVPNTYPLLKNW